MLAAAMKSGHWMVTSQGIGINLHGQLIDAHHRLTACVQANVPFQSAIIWGLSEEAYQVTDRGIARNYEDILSCPKAVAEVLRHAGSLLVGNGRPTAQDIKPLIDIGMDDAVTALIKYCPSKRAYFSCAMFKLGAILRIMDRHNADFIYSQYRALVMADYDSMTSASKALTRQATSGNLVVTNKNDVLARSLVVFDQKKKNISKVQIDDDQRLAADEYARFVLRRAIGGVSA